MCNEQAGGSVSDVLLPPWAATPCEFVALHRQALESEYVHCSTALARTEGGGSLWEIGNLAVVELYGMKLTRFGCLSCCRGCGVWLQALIHHDFRVD